MKILLIAYYYPPNHSSGGQRPLKMAELLPRFGHDVVVLTSSYAKKAGGEKNVIRVYDPSHNKNRVGLRRFQWLARRTAVELQNRAGIYSSIYAPWKRAVLGKAAEIIARTDPGCILATYPPVETLEIGLELSQRFRLPLISDFRDGLMFRSIEEKRLAAHRCVFARYAKIEAAAASASSLIVAVTPVLRDYFLDAYPGSRCETIFNGFDDGECLDLPAISLRDGEFHVVHTGRIALSDSAADMGPFISAWRRIVGRRAGPPARLHLVGEYSRREKSLLADMVRSGAAVLHPLMERRETLAMQKAADLLLLVTRPGVRSGIPLKLFEYIRSGKPILALSDDGEVRRIVAASGTGWCVPPQDEEAIASQLERVLAGHGRRSSLERRPDLIAGFSWESQMGGLHRLLAALPPWRRWP